MPYTTLKGENVPIKLWARVDEVGSDALAQLRGVARLPWVAHHVAVMPDVHLGRGATVGSVIAMRGGVSPAAVGVDIGCGMAAVQTNLLAGDLPDSLRALRSDVEAAVPLGMRSHGEPAWPASPLAEQARALLARSEELAVRDPGRASVQLGTLGGGNHFVELCRDGEQRVWLMLHSGSRHLGASLAQHHMEVARRLRHNQALVDRELAAFLAGTPEFDAYRRDLYWAQEYALANRGVLLFLVTGVLQRHFPQLELATPIACHHNYVAEEEHFGEPLLVTRKGAIRARAGELGIIPGSMGTRSYIVRGRGNPQAFESASHGAGRRMSRTQARRAFSVADLRRQTEGVECRKDDGVLDEAPKAYKKIEQVMAQQEDLVEIVAELTPLMCLKG